jgi:hypothetical protein
MLPWLEKVGAAVLARKGTILVTSLVVVLLDALLLADVLDGQELLRWCVSSLRTRNLNPSSLNPEM